MAKHQKTSHKHPQKQATPQVDTASKELQNPAPEPKQTESAPASKQAEPAPEPNKPSLQKNTSQEKSIIKPLFVFAMLAFAVGGAALDYYLTTPMPLHEFKAIEPPLAASALVQPAQNDLPPEAALKESETAIALPASSQQEDQSNKIRQLKQRIHELEIANLNLSEKVSSTEDTTPITLQLVERIYTGKTFNKQLTDLLKKDKHNRFGQDVQAKLGAFASVGIPTKLALKNMFNNNFDYALDAYYMAERADSWDQQFSAYLKSLFYVYPEHINPETAKGVELLFLARQQVENDQFEKARETIYRLPAASQQYFSRFVRSVDAYYTALDFLTPYLNQQNERKQ